MLALLMQTFKAKASDKSNCLISFHILLPVFRAQHNQTQLSEAIKHYFAVKHL